MSVLKVPYHLDEFLPDLDLPLGAGRTVTADLPAGDVWTRLGTLYRAVASAVAREAQRLAAALKREVEQDGGLRSRVQVLGPAPAGLSRLQGRYRWQLLLKSYGRPALATALGHLRRLFSPLPRTLLNLTLDIDPNNLY